MPLRTFADVRSKLSRFSSKGDRKGKGKGKSFKGKGKKGKGKGKGKWGAAGLKSNFWVHKKEEEDRNDIDGTYSGTVAKYVWKLGWGFIKPDDPSVFPEDVQQMLEKAKEEAKAVAQEKGKEEIDDILIYFRKPDIDPDYLACHVDPDDNVTFEIYTDNKGVGAHQIKGVDATADKEKIPIRIRKGEKSGGKGKRREEKGKGHDKGAGRGRGEKDHVIELEETDPSFPLRMNIVGEGGKNVKHIEETYDSRVTVSRWQPLVVKIYSDTDKNLNGAVKMMEDLIGVVWEEYLEEQKDSKRKPKGSGKDRGDKTDKARGKGSSGRDDGGKGKGKTDAKFTKSIKLRTCDPEFRLRSAIVGDKGSYVKHIQDECSVQVNVREEGGEMKVEINAETQDGLKKADAMTRDLINAAYQKYDDWKAETGAKAKPSQGSKGKGKRDRDDDGPAHKRRRL